LRYDIEMRDYRVIAFLNSFFEPQRRWRIGGTYAIDIDPAGRRVFLNLNAADLARDPNADAGFGHPLIAVVHLPEADAPPLPSPGLRFDDVTEPAGLAVPLAGAYVHAAAWGDADGDGWPELLAGTFVQGPAQVPNRLFINRHGRFAEAGQPVVHTSGRASGAAFADLDGDGDLDLFVSNNRIAGTAGPSDLPSRLLRNDGGTFTDVTAGSGIDAQATNGRQAGVLDFDADGRLDLFIVADALRGSGPTVLLANRGGLRFEDVARAAGLPGDVHGLGLAIGDVSGDGWADVFVAGGPTGREAYRNYLFVADRDGTFHRAPDAGFDWRPFVHGGEDWVSGAALGDVDRDGRLDMLVGHHFGSSAEAGIGASLRLYVNRGTDARGDPMFDDVTDRAGLPPILAKAPHVDIEDFDNDGWPDLYTSVLVGAPGGATPLVFRNSGMRDGVPTFSGPPLVNPRYFAGGPVADFDRDGRPDVFLSEFRSVLQGTSEDEGPVASRLMRNTSVGGNWLDVEVADPDHPLGIGAIVTVYREGMAGTADGLLGRAEIGIGSGFSSGGEAVAHFGLGDQRVVDVVVRIPSGGPTFTREAVPANRRVTLPSGPAEPPAHLGLSATAEVVTSRLFLDAPAAALPPHSVASEPPKVHFAAFPRPDYAGNPWSQWGAGLVASNGRYYAAIGDHFGKDGNAYVYEFDPAGIRLRCVGDVQTAVGHVPGSWGHGKIHSRITEAGDGFIYMTSYWGSSRNIVFDANYRGSVILRYPLEGAGLAPEVPSPASPTSPAPTMTPTAGTPAPGWAIHLPLGFAGR